MPKLEFRTKYRATPALEVSFIEPTF